MQCIRPLKASLREDGSVTFSIKQSIKGLVPFEISCRKCLPCRLNQAREKAIRCYHESKIYPDSIFLTLTYDDEHLESPKLIYKDFQLFIKRLREYINRDLTTKAQRDSKRISYMVTGEYGDKTKRPHWHVIIFNYYPEDAEYKYSNDLGDKVYTSKLIDQLWQKGITEFGSVTLESASYVARYASKKLCHGKDQEHEFHPIHRTSCKKAIGKSWIEKYWKHTFDNGFVVLPNGSTAKIPRYYVDWFKENHPDEFIKYHFGVRKEIQLKAEAQSRKDELDYYSQCMNYRGNAAMPLKKKNVKEIILQSKFKRLQENLKL